MTTPTAKGMTAEEFGRMPDLPDGSRQELVWGVIVILPPTKGPRGACCAKVVLHLGNFVEEHKLGRVFSNGVGFILERDPDTVRGPDVSFWSRARLPQIPEEYIDIPPDLLVEVVSPSDHFTRVQNKARHYLDRGVRLVWVVDPEDRSVTVYRSREQVKILLESETLTGEDVVPGFSCRVADLLV